MTKLPLGLALAAVLVLSGCGKPGDKTPAPAQKDMKASGRYDPLQTFAKLTLPHPVNAYRSGNGAPGPAYWQNRADYKMAVHLEPAKKVLTGDETITYTNNSPDRLDALWLRMEQNHYKADSRATLAVPVPKRYAAMAKLHTKGFELDNVSVEMNGKTYKADTLISDTRMQIRLPVPMAPHSALKLHIAWHFTIPGRWGGRMGWGPSKNGDIFDMAQFYPRMAVYDDLRGWDTLPYLANEFYLEYGDFDYTVTVPSDMLVAGTGELVNAKDVLTAPEQAQLAKARASDATVYIRAPGDVNNPASRPKQSGELTWHFQMHDTRDIAFSASRAFVWDAARINLPDHKSALSMSFYPVESVGKDAWTRSTQYIKDSVENFSRRWYPFPWPAAINVAGPASGMEYPGMAFDGITDKGKPLFWISAHEIGHSWFPMLVGSNERRDAWMDEGFNTFVDTYESDDFNHGEFGPKRDAEFAPGGGNPVEEIQSVLKDPDAPIIMTRADAIREKYRHPVTYFKAALGLKLLREQILGPKRFDFAFRKYISDWAFKHPSPSDFFREMDSAGGEDLSWFWRGWFFHNWDADLAVTKVAYTDGDAAKGATVTVANLDRLVMPAWLEVVLSDGTKIRRRIPAEAWIQQREVEVPVDSTKPITSATIDPDQVIPDENRSNNTLKGPF